MKIKKIMTDAIRFWERLRIPYNLILASIVVYYAIPPIMKQRGMNWELTAIQLFIFAVLANVAYTFAYLVDIPVQFSDFQPGWRRIRIGLFIIGTVFAACITWLIATAMFTPWGTW
jgi:hypothetical protein